MRHQVLYFCLLLLLLGNQAARAQILSSHIGVSTGPPIWSYTLFNEEPPDSPNYISAFTVAADAPITVTRTPSGWDYQTDNSSYVFWFNTDLALPYPHDLAPGQSLGGFEITSIANTSQMLGTNLVAWNHLTDSPGPTVQGFVLSPSLSVTPEPSACSILVAGLMSAAIFLAHDLWRKKFRC